jgi:hypothetical protein
MAIRVENLSAADQELAPGSGFIPAHSFRDYPADEYRAQHEKYAKARLEADPPILRVTEVSDQEAGSPEEKSPAQQQTEQNADDARRAEEQKRIEELKQRQAELSGDQAKTEDTRRRR